MIQHVLVSVIIALGMYLSVKGKKLTLYASATGGFFAFIIYTGVGYLGIVLLSAFFVSGTFATFWRYNEKRGLALSESDNGVRTVGQVVANAGFAAMLGFLACLYPGDKELFLLMTAAGFSSAVSDTLSSELGNIYGTRYYNIISFKADKRGMDGVVSAEGTFFGISGSLLIACIYSLYAGFTIDFLWIVLAGTLGNLFDSLLGASLERKRILNNNAVNFLNTVLAALVVWLIKFF
ncbi:MAG: DUF92 domain-containing protein [Sphingobacteriaceae bacterium]|nr:DUF92 domain-containing protein [Sphingobacteriaceae bacterium]